MNSRRIGAIVLAAAAALAAGPVRAHYLWIESHPQGTVVFFGEYDEKLHERSPGRLDEMPSPRAWSMSKGARHELDVQRASDRFVLGGERNKATVLVEETGYAVRDWTKQGIGIVKPLYYARHARNAASEAPALTLDVLPTDRTFGKLAVYFKGQPLAKAKLEVYAPNGWKQEHRTDETGHAAIKLPWRGLYVVEVVHLEKAPGEFSGTQYEARRHRATLSFRK